MADTIDTSNLVNESVIGKLASTRGLLAVALIAIASETLEYAEKNSKLRRLIAASKWTPEICTAKINLHSSADYASAIPALVTELFPETAVTIVFPGERIDESPVFGFENWEDAGIHNVEVVPESLATSEGFGTQSKVVILVDIAKPPAWAKSGRDFVLILGGK